jgi:hypothetical protein
VLDPALDPDPQGHVDPLAAFESLLATLPESGRTMKVADVMPNMNATERAKRITGLAERMYQCAESACAAGDLGRATIVSPVRERGSRWP